MAVELDRPSPSSAFLSFVRLESAGGVLLLVGTALAMVAANTPLAASYELLLDTRLTVRIGETGIDKPPAAVDQRRPDGESAAAHAATRGAKPSEGLSHNGPGIRRSP